MTDHTSAFEHMLAVYSDMHKDAFGTRPRGQFEYLRQLTSEQLQHEIDLVEQIVADQIEQQRTEPLEEEINYMLQMGAPDEQAAHRWAEQALYA